MKKVLILLVVMALVGSASAEVLTWVGGLMGNPSDEWMLGTANQWVDPVLTPMATPGSADYALVIDATYGGAYNLLPFPVIRTNVGTVDYLGVALHTGFSADLTIEAGGALAVTNIVTVAGDGANGVNGGLAGDGNCFGTITSSGALTIGSEFRVGEYAGTAQINLDAGSITAATLVIAGINSNIDIESGAALILIGDVTGDVAGWIGSGAITASDGTAAPVYYISGGNTVVVPEPATMMLLGLGGLVSLIRKRK